VITFSGAADPTHFPAVGTATFEARPPPRCRPGRAAARRARPGRQRETRRTIGLVVRRA
jgi:hypothetical protein